MDIAREEKDKTEESIHVLDKSDNGKWVREGHVVDSGLVECVTGRRIMPRCRVEEYAGGKEIKKEGKVTVSWRTDGGTVKRHIQSWTSVQKIDQCGDVIVTKRST